MHRLGRSRKCRCGATDRCTTVAQSGSRTRGEEGGEENALLVQLEHRRLFRKTMLAMSSSLAGGALLVLSAQNRTMLLLFAGASTVAAASLWAAGVEVTLHNGNVRIQWGAPKDGPPMEPGSVEVKDTGTAKGRGAFAAKVIPKGTKLGAYEGEVLDNKEFFNRYPEGMADYAMGLDPDRVIDAKEAAKRSEFTPAHINHSRSPNVVRRYEPKEGNIYFFAKRDIDPGEELLLDYGRRYWLGREDEEIA